MNKPWLHPGYRFTIGWPVGYTPRAAEAVLADRKGRAHLQMSGALTQKRMEAADNGIDYGNGTIPGLSKKAHPNDPAKAGRMKKASGL